MKTSAKIDLKSFFSRLSKNLGLVVLIVLLALFILEAFEIKKTVSIILSANQQAPLVNSQPGVGVNFNGYNQAVERMQNAQTFVPPAPAAANPFGVARN